MTCFKIMLLAAALVSPSRAETVIKFATLAPAGSTWMKTMQELDKELQEKTHGDVRFKFYPGGVSGDEKDVVRKMRLGQLQAAGLTGVGLGEINPEVRVLDSPFLFRDSAEADHILKMFDKDLPGALESKGFALLGWAEVGFVYMFTNIPAHTPADLKAAKMWVWEGDPIAEAAFKAFDIHPIPLSITDVMTGLQTGMIDGVYSSPMAVIALQWFTKTKFMHDFPIAYASGAVVVSQKTVDSLPAEERRVLMDLGRREMRRLCLLSREENRQAMETLKHEGLAFTEPTPETVRLYEETGQKARKDLAGRLYSAALLDRIQTALAKYRADAKKH